MSVEVEYIGRFGNNLFQYVAARLFAKDNDLAMRTPWIHPEVLEARPHVHENLVPDHFPEIRLGDADQVLGKPWRPGNYRLSGFFQYVDWYRDRRDEIRRLFRLHEVRVRGEDEIAMHVRREDYLHHQIAIDASWYEWILKGQKFRKLTIIGKDIEPQWLEPFRKWVPEVIQGPARECFHLLRSFERVILSNSTFAWWAAFLGIPSQVYTFSRWIRNPKADLARFPGATMVEGRFEKEA